MRDRLLNAMGILIVLLIFVGLIFNSINSIINVTEIRSKKRIKPLIEVNNGDTIYIYRGRR